LSSVGLRPKSRDQGNQIMTATEQSNRLPIKMRPTLKLKLGPAPNPPVTTTFKVAEAAAPEPPGTPPHPEHVAAIREAIQQRALKTLEALADRFPLCFGRLVPLKINIQRDIYAAAPELNRHDVMNALDGYCNGKAYQTALVEGAARLDLNGCPVGFVTAGHARYATRQLRTPLD
jgi:hypothetical protein